MSLPILSDASVNALLFGVYGITQRYFVTHNQGSETYHVSIVEIERHQLPLSQVMICGMVAGTFTTLIVSPVDLVKSRLQIQVSKTNMSQER